MNTIKLQTFPTKKELGTRIGADINRICSHQPDLIKAITQTYNPDKEIRQQGKSLFQTAQNSLPEEIRQIIIHKISLLKKRDVPGFLTVLNQKNN